MECACDIDSGDGGSWPAVFNRSDRRARCTHKCYECGRTINPGERYTVESGLWDGEWRTFKTCADCLSVRESMFSSYLFGTLWEGIGEYIDDCAGRVPEKCLYPITRPARIKIAGMIDDWFRGCDDWSDG